MDYFLCMVTTTIHNGKLAEMGCKRTVARTVAGYTVEIAVAFNGFDDYVLDILVGLNNQKVGDEILAEIRNEIALKESEIFASFGY